ncbi:MAG: two-component regulator propeller domain-containing protein [Bacteroidota bacterium]
MNINSIKAIIITLVSINFICCKGQVKPESIQVETKPSEIGQLVTVLDNDIWAIFHDSKGNYWFGSNGKGVYQYDGMALKLMTTNEGLLDNTIRGIQEDHKGNIFIETPVGVSKFNGSELITLEVLNTSKSTWENNSTDLWFNGIGDYLYRFDGERLHDLKLPKQDSLLLKLGVNITLKEMAFNPYSVYGIDKDKNGNIWFGTENAGAFRYDGNSFLWIGEKELSTLPDGRVPGVRSMIQDKDGYMWLSNFYSKYKINPNLPKGYEKVKAVNLPGDVVKDKILYFNSGTTDQKGNLWMTTYRGGIWRYNGITLSNQEIHNGKERVLLVSIYEDKNGTIWLGTRNDGVYKLTGNSFEKFEPGK